MAADALDASATSATRGDEAVLARADRFFGVGLAIILAILGFIPIADWIPGGQQLESYALLWQEWASGLAICIGGAIVLGILLRPFPRVDELGRGLALSARMLLTGRALPILAFVLYAVIALAAFGGRPLLIDEIAQVFHAQILAAGHLALPTPAHPEFFSALHIVDTNGKVFSQFPVGGPAMLALGVLLHATWMVGPLSGAASVWLWRAIVQRAGGSEDTWVPALFAFAPFVAFMAGSHMNHVTSLAWILVGVYGTVRMAHEAPGNSTWALLAGLGFGISATIRPVDAACFALPAAAWMLLWVRRPGGLLALALAGIGVAIPLLTLFAINAQTTGHPTLFGYEVLWGKSHNLGFHRAPWGLVHTPARGLEMINAYFVSLQRVWLEAPFPGLLPAIVTLAFTRRFRALDRYLAASASLLIVSYWAYWHPGFYLGPRFMYALAPALSLWTLRAIPLLAHAARNWSEPRRRYAHRLVVLSMLVAGVIAIGHSIPQRTRLYRSPTATERFDAVRALRLAGATDALVLVRESWESQMVVRMWALGISHPDVETLYRSVDACRLDRAIDSLERRMVDSASSRRALWTMLPESARLVTRKFGAGVNVRYDPTRAWERLCLHRLEETRDGVSPLAPMLIVKSGRTVFARDLHARDSMLFADFPGRSLWLMRPASGDAKALPALWPVSLDSMRAAWREDEMERPRSAW